jgi:hypothetical protein
MLQIIY